MSTFITRLADSGPGLAVAVKDLIDLAGTPTTAGCRALERKGTPAPADAACLREIRRLATAGELWIVGKTNLHELAYGVTGINPWFGTPTNPLDPRLVPGGSSSGSAVAVAVGDADVALGSDTGGSVRIPAACCGVAGLKTTWGRVPLAGVWPLAPSLDTIGPIARDVAGLVIGMRLLEAGFVVSPVSDVEIGRLAVDADPLITEAVDRALAATGLATRPVQLPGWLDAWAAADVVLSAEAWRADRDLLASDPAGVGDVATARIVAGEAVTEEAERRARRAQLEWQRTLEDLLAQVPVIALPTLVEFPPALDVGRFRANRWTLPVNFAGLPALSIPVPSRGPLPASLQLVGPPYSEDLLLAVGRRIEAAAGAE
ncbi:MAG: amidase [Frankiaceae bacterium]|jgi:amidase|nr:amidase [Frankiaceae bacterium]